MTLKLNLTVKNYLQIFGFFQLKLLGRAKNNICTSGVTYFYPQCFVEPSSYAVWLQTAPQVKIMHFTPSVHNLLRKYASMRLICICIFSNLYLCKNREYRLYRYEILVVLSFVPESDKGTNRAGGKRQQGIHFLSESRSLIVK
jgi:hypothetical protein